MHGHETAPWVEAWLPEEQVDRRSFALVAKWEGSDIAVVEIDREHRAPHSEEVPRAVPRLFKRVRCSSRTVQVTGLIATRSDVSWRLHAAGTLR
jgi:hypothetical protein